jgi:hypothetical protein
VCGCVVGCILHFFTISLLCTVWDVVLLLHNPLSQNAALCEAVWATRNKISAVAFAAVVAYL